SLAEAHASLGFIAWQRWDWLNAQSEFERAIALNPNYAPAHLWYGGYFRSIGRRKEALAELKWAQRLDPLFPPIAFGGGFYEMGLYDRAIAVLKDWLEMNSGYPAAIALLADCYVKKNMYDEALSSAREALTLSGNQVYFQERLARIYAQTGNRDDALKILE